MPFLCRSCALRLKIRIKHVFNPSPPSRLHQRAFSSTPSLSRPFRLAIIGSGPAGFYSAGRVMREQTDCKIDMYERLPVPFGLVRYGVAPDHPEVKNCEERFNEIASAPNFEFIGNIDIGYDISFKSLKPHYDAILFTYGASKDKELGVPGEHLAGVLSAHSFVAWYNGHPGYSHLKPILNQGTEAVIIGQGNVALDVARILLTGVDTLRKTDMPEYALEVLSKSKFSHVHAIGRRGPLQAAFTIKEVRELTTMPHVAFGTIPRDLFPEDLQSLPRARRRISELLTKAGAVSGRDIDPTMSFSLDFLLSPVEFRESNSRPGNLESVVCQRNAYINDSELPDPKAAVGLAADETQLEFKSTVAFRSIGYKSEPLPGLSSLGIPFDAQRGIIPNQLGRVVSAVMDGDGVNPPLPGIYVAGWVKRGPTGVIASTMEDAFGTAENIMHDAATGRQFLNGRMGSSSGLGWDGVKREAETKGLRRTNWADWKAIDAVERERGKQLGKPREKIIDIEDMLKVLG